MNALISKSIKGLNIYDVVVTRRSGRHFRLVSEKHLMSESYEPIQGKREWTRWNCWHLYSFCYTSQVRINVRMTLLREAKRRPELLHRCAERKALEEGQHKA